MASLMTSISNRAAAENSVRLWRRTYNVSDPRANVARRLGDGSVRQGKIVISTIIETATKWFKHTNEAARHAYAEQMLAFEQGKASVAEEPQRPTKLKWNILATLEAVLSFLDFKTGECIATYEMIAKAAECGRDTVYKHINRLRELGLIDWVRRCEPTGNKIGQKTKAAPNAYFFEITRLPSAVQMLMRQILTRRGVKLASHPERQGSGSVPNRAQRLATKLGKTLSSAESFLQRKKRQTKCLAEADFVREETQLMGDIPTERWAAIRHPGDLAAQQAYNARLGIHALDHESMEMPLQSPPTEQFKKVRGR
ncbi:helix-turn-helix domain-containing protein [Novosphingobium sp. BW1]|uniref:helix-turn-helix domain-containing protein n=1 Tax=Novosphingobium sp. BW1 TaxID=2592621 RepID=UPI0013967B7E|nr:helix-turn-helix domain-containing protein [Novosphingobium sp. BW1]